MLSQRTTIIWAVIAVALFSVLLGARSLVANVASAGPDVQGAYEELAQALDSARLLPLGMDDEWLMAMAQLARNASSVSPQGDPATSGDVIALGSVIEARSTDRKITYLKLRPEYSKELIPGKLAKALVKVSRINAKAQLAAGGTGGSQSKAEFGFSVDGEAYDCMAYFNGNQLDEIVITAK